MNVVFGIGNERMKVLDWLSIVIDIRVIYSASAIRQQHVPAVPSTDEFPVQKPDG